MRIDPDELRKLIKKQENQYFKWASRACAAAAGVVSPASTDCDRRDRLSCTPGFSLNRSCRPASISCHIQASD